MKNINGYGCVYKLQGNRRKKWNVRVTIGYTIDGKQIRKSLGVYRTKGEALEKLVDYNKNPNLYSDIKFKDIRLRWWSKQQNKYKDERSKGTVEIIVNRLEPLDNIELNKFNLLFLQDFFDNLDATNGVKKKIKLRLKQIIDYAIKLDLMEQNKAKYIEIGKTKKKFERKIFTSKEIKKLWGNVKVDKVQCILILIYTGLRISEFLNLENKDIDLLNKIVYIKDSKTRAGIRKIPISDKIIELFKTKYSTKKYFHYNNNKRENYQSFLKGFRNVLNSLGISEHRIHDTRHTFATLLSDNDANETSIIKLIGHSDYKTTQNIYTHKDIEELRKAINLIN